MITEIKVPKLPESVPDAVVAEILPKVGDAVVEGDRLVDLDWGFLLIPIEGSGPC